MNDMPPNTPTNNNTNTDQLQFEKQQKLFYTAIITNDTKTIQSFLSDPLASQLCSQFKYLIKKRYIPRDQLISPIIVAIIRMKLTVLQLLINAQTNTFNPKTYTEHGLPLFFYALGTENNEIIDHVLSLYQTTTSTTSTTITVNTYETIELSINESTISTEPIATTNTTNTASTTTLINPIDTIISSRGRTALQFAILYLTIPVIKRLIEHYKCNPFIKDKNIQNILHFASRSPLISTELFDYLLSIDGINGLLEEGDIIGDTPLFTLAHKNQTTIIKHIITHHNVNICHSNIDGYTLAHVFAHNGDVEMIKYILERQPNLLHKVNTSGESLLVIGMVQNKFDVVKYCVEDCQFDINQRAQYGPTILHDAMKACTNEIIDYIINLNPLFLNTRDDIGNTPLFYAAKNGRVEGFKHLINVYKVSPFVVNVYEKNMLFYAKPNIIDTIANAFETCPLPSKQTTNIHGENNNVLIENQDGIINLSIDPIAEQHGCLIISELPNNYTKITGEWFDDQPSPLHHHILQCNLECVQKLVRLKANITDTNPIHIVDECFGTILHFALHWAQHKENYTVLEYLLSDTCVKDWNSQMELKFNDDETIRIYGQNDPIMSQLEIECPDECDSKATLLLQSVYEHDLTAIQLLIEKKTNVGAIDKAQDFNIIHKLFQKTPTEDVPQDKLFDIIQYLLSLPQIDTTTLFTQHSTYYDRTPLLYATPSCSFPIIQHMIESNATINDIDANQCNLLHLAASNQHFSFVQELLQHYYPHKIQLEQLQHHDYRGYTPFHTAISTTKINKKQQNEIKDGDNNNDVDSNSKDACIHNTGSDFHNPDIQTFIQHDLTFLFINTLKNETICHIAVQTDCELPTRLASLIEAVIDAIDIME